MATEIRTLEELKKCEKCGSSNIGYSGGDFNKIISCFDCKAETAIGHDEWILVNDSFDAEGFCPIIKDYCKGSKCVFHKHQPEGVSTGDLSNCGFVALMQLIFGCASDPAGLMANLTAKAWDLLKY